MRGIGAHRIDPAHGHRAPPDGEVLRSELAGADEVARRGLQTAALEEPPRAGSREPRPPATTPPARTPSRVPWAELLSRVFKVDVLKCENCGGRMTVLAFLTGRAVVKKILEHLGLPATGPPKAPARGAAQLELDERPADEPRDELPN